MALWQGNLDSSPALTRVQGAPICWSFLDPSASKASSLALDALTRIHKEGSGALVLMHLEPPHALIRSAFHRDFVGDAETPLRANADTLRDLGTGCQILVDIGLRDLRLLTSSKRPIVGIEAYGLSIVDRIEIF